MPYLQKNLPRLYGLPQTVLITFSPIKSCIYRDTGLKIYLQHQYTKKTENLEKSDETAAI